VQRLQDHGGGPSAEPSVLTVVEAATLLQVKPGHVYRLLNSGEMPGRRVGGVWRISRPQLLNWLEGRHQ
jgi:excisionase family DNA binding protein